jgi:hypothetical protein
MSLQAKICAVMAISLLGCRTDWSDHKDAREDHGAAPQRRYSYAEYCVATSAACDDMCRSRGMLTTHTSYEHPDVFGRYIGSCPEREPLMCFCAGEAP